MKKVFENIQQRYSVRNYNDKQIEDSQLGAMKEFLRSNVRGPLGNAVRFTILDGSVYNPEELKKLGTYGMIRGAKYFIAGAVKREKYAMEDYGYCMEKNILKATELGLGSCWLGGALSRSEFASKITKSDNEIIPAVSSLGYPAKSKTFKDKVSTLLVRASKRKAPEKLFFDCGRDKPLDLQQYGTYAKVLEAVRNAPSAANMQPWRIIKQGDAYHFYLKETGWYNNLKMLEGAKLQNIDMGIAMAHFELAATASSLAGRWDVSEPELEKGKLKYIATWNAE